jgi:hypothetical protein
VAQVVVRGHAAAGYHNDILQVVSRKLEPAGFQAITRLLDERAIDVAAAHCTVPHLIVKQSTAAANLKVPLIPSAGTARINPAGFSGKEVN